jgi:hypothetical protein
MEVLFVTLAAEVEVKMVLNLVELQLVAEATGRNQATLALLEPMELVAGEGEELILGMAAMEGQV